MIQPAGAAMVEKVEKDSPAANAGLMPGDIVTGLNGTPIFNTSLLSMKSKKSDR
jgi:S1-C subfamily serine protease